MLFGVLKGNWTDIQKHFCNENLSININLSRFCIRISVKCLVMGSWGHGVMFTVVTRRVQLRFMSIYDYLVEII